MTYREHEIERTTFSSFGDLFKYQKSQQEEFQRGYNDYMAKRRASAYQRGREQAARDLAQLERNRFFNFPCNAGELADMKSYREAMDDFSFWGASLND